MARNETEPYNKLDRWNSLKEAHTHACLTTFINQDVYTGKIFIKIKMDISHGPVLNLWLERWKPCKTCLCLCIASLSL